MIVPRCSDLFNYYTARRVNTETVIHVLTCLSSVRCATPEHQYMTSATDISELDPVGLEVAMKGMGVRSFHARQIYKWIYQQGITDFDQMSDLSLTLRRQLVKRFVVGTLTVSNRQRSTDGTEKFLLRLSDGQLIESVFIPDTPKQTFCVSTQVGCSMRCSFCLTGKMKLVRNLTAGEIVGQVRLLAHSLRLADKNFNVVFMGMGEPLHNYDATMKALRILTNKNGFAVPPRRITVSTVGVPSGLRRLANESIMPNLAVSLHASTEELRNRLVPVNRTVGLADVIEACRQLPLTKRRRLTFEYVLLGHVNDSVQDAWRLQELLRGLKAKVNLIPLNEASEISFRRPSDVRVNRFARTLSDGGMTVSVRKSRGRDIRAACGQLIVEGDVACTESKEAQTHPPVT